MSKTGGLTGSRPTGSDGTGKAKRLNLGFEDGEDLKIAAAVLQDAVVAASDITFLKQTRRFALVANRFCWELGGKIPLRARSGLHFDHVTAVRTKGIDRDAITQALNLLTIEAQEHDQGVTIDLIFAGEVMIRLQADVIEGGLKDLAGPWATTRRPKHNLDEGAL